MELHRQNLASAKSLTDNGEPHQTFRKYNAKKVEKEQERMFEMDAVRIGSGCIPVVMHACLWTLSEDRLRIHSCCHACLT